MAIPKTAIFVATNANAQKPIENGSTSKSSIPSSKRSLVVELLDAINAGNTTETRLIKTTDIEKRNSVQLGRLFFLICLFSGKSDSGEFVFSCLFLNVFANWLYARYNNGINYYVIDYIKADNQCQMIKSR